MLVWLSLFQQEGQVWFLRGDFPGFSDRRKQMAEKHIPGQPFPCPGAMLNPGRAPDGGERSLLSLGGDEDLLIGLQTLQDLGEVGGVWCHLSTPTPKLVLDFNGLAEKYVIFGLVELFFGEGGHGGRWGRWRGGCCCCCCCCWRGPCAPPAAAPDPPTPVPTPTSTSAPARTRSPPLPRGSPPPAAAAALGALLRSLQRPDRSRGSLLQPQRFGRGLQGGSPARLSPRSWDPPAAPFWTMATPQRFGRRR
ncbi:pro-FMRFamide-related neuropeptide FF [Accipiter gentilis]|uniref:pro-FMRFamide-related neuropeptide FF n=1 Tax=Astur gentilis TaxID=8957 RepID=UPI00210FF106|nr:pro-FMRFamide-related neuropeptide FF [Accipiter gentilis]